VTSPTDRETNKAKYITFLAQKSKQLTTRVYLLTFTLEQLH